MNTKSVADRDRTFWEQHAKSYDVSLRVLNRNLPRLRELAATAVQGATRVLEVAAGTGVVTTAMAKTAREVVATDYSDAMVRALEQRVHDAGLSNVRCERADLYALSYEAASFDAVVAANVLHLVPDLDGALVALRRMLAPGGKLIVPTFCHDETLASAVVSRVLAVTRFPGHRRFTAASLRRALEDRGVRVSCQEILDGVIPIAYVEGVFPSAP